MAISYKDYKKKYETQNKGRNFNTLPTQRNLTKQEAYNNYQARKIEKQNAIDSLQNSYSDKGIVVTKNTFMPTANLSTYYSDQTQYNKRAFEKGLNDVANIRDNLFSQQKEAFENIDKYKEHSKSDEVKEKEKKVVEEYNKTANAYNIYQQKRLEEDDIGFYDKTLGRLVDGITSPFSQFKGEAAVNDNGDLYYVPSYNDLKQQKVLDSYGDGFWGTVGKIGSGALYEGGKIITSAALNKALPGVGTAVYFSDIYTKQLNNAVADGYDETSALAYATLGTAAEVITGKLLGGTSKAIFGGSSSELSQTISKSLSKIVQNHPHMINSLSNAISEGSEEFIQEFIDKFNRNITLGEENKVLSKDTLEDALYSAAVGSLTGIASGATDGSDYSKLESQRNDYVDTKVKLPTQNNIQESVINSGIKNQIQQNNFQNINYNNQSPQSTSQNNIEVTSPQKSQPTFSQQVDEVLKGTYPKRDMLKISEHTPKILQEIGLNDLPITMTQKHLYTITNKDGKYSGVNYHDIDIDVVKQLPKALENPLNILKSDTKDDSIVVVTELADKNDDIIVASIKIDGKGTIQDVRIDTNVMTSAYGKSKNYDYFMKDNISKGNLLYDIDDGIIKKINNSTQKKSDARDRLQLPIRSSSSNTTSDIPKNISPISYGNNIPQSNDNVKLPSATKYSMQENTNNTWQEYLNNHYKPTGTRTNMQDIKLKGNDILQATRINEVKKVSTKKTSNKDNNTNENVRSWSETVTESDSLDQKVIEEAMKGQDYTYVPDSNKRQVEHANAMIRTQGFERALETHRASMKSDKRVTANDLALSQRLLQEASKKGDVKIVRELIIDNAVLGTELGQAVQSLSIIKKLSPEGQLQVLQKTVDRMKSQDPKKTENVEITDEMINTILGSKNSNELANNMDKVKEQIAQQMPVKFTDKIVAWRYLSMLGNPKTHIRNIVSNFAMKETMGVKNKISAIGEAIFDKSIKKRGQERTKTLKKSSKDVIDYVNNYSRDVSEKLGQSSKYSMELEMKKAQKIFGDKGFGKFVQTLYDFNSKALGGEDIFFKNKAFKSAMANYLTANGINTKAEIENNPNLVNNAYLYATEESLKATFQQYSSLATMLNNLKKTNPAGELILDALVPFTKTPANILKTGASYSPLGLLKSVTYDSVKLKQGKINVTQYIDNISQGLTGTGIVLLGYVLAQSGFITGAGDDDKEGEYDENLGNQSYSVKIGGNTYTLDWLSPVAMPLFVGAEISHMQEEGTNEVLNMNTATKMMTSTFDPMMQMSLLQGINNALSGFSDNKIEAIVNESIKSYVGQFFPTVGGQIAKTIDPTIRSTGTSKDSGYTLGEQILRQNMAKIPGVTYLLEPATDIWGNERQRSDSVIKRALENAVLPYSRKELTETTIDKELKEIYSKTGEDRIIPKAYLNKYITFNGEKYETDAKSYTQFKKTYGTTAYKTLENLFKTETYKNAEDEEKVKLIENTYTYASDVSKQEFLKTKDVVYTNSKKDNTPIYKENYITQVINDDISWESVAYREKSPSKYKVLTSFGVKYDDFAKYQDEVQKIKNEYPGEENTNIRKSKVFRYINSLSLSKTKKVMLFKSAAGYGISNYQDYLYSYVKSLDLSKKDKEEIWSWLYD